MELSLETIFDLVRKEKSSNTLQELEPDFYSSLASYLKEKKEFLESIRSKPAFTREDIEKEEMHYRNIERLVRELIALREKKIIGMALYAVRTGSIIDTSMLTPIEKKFYEDLLRLIKNHEESLIAMPQQQEQATEEDDFVLVKFKKDMPEFLGLEGEVYGPFKKDDMTKLPKEIASVLVEKDVIEYVM